MLQTQTDVTALLVRRKVVSAEQAEDARNLCLKHGGTAEDALVKLGYATTFEVAVAYAELLGMPFVDLTKVNISPFVIDLVPSSVVRENMVIPLSLSASRSTLTVATAAPFDADVIEKLRFILDKDIHCVLATREQIAEAISRCYGVEEQESVDSMLCEFTDTQIDFTERESGDKDVFETDFDLPALEDESASQAVALDESDTDLQSSDFDLSSADCMRSSVDEMLLDESNLDSKLRAADAAAPAKPRAPLVQRHATVRYFYRMNPLRMVPLMVVISRKTLREIEKKNVTQKRSQDFEVALDSIVEIEPILPGCQCYPPKEQLSIGRGEVSVRFQVVPHVLGNVDEARVVVRQHGKALAEVPLEARVVQQSMTLLIGAMSLVLPFGLMLLKHLGLDFESQRAEDFSLYAQLGSWLVQSVRPEVMTLVLLGVTAGFYLWLRPRQRDVFWDLRTEPRPGALPEEKPATRTSESGRRKTPPPSKESSAEHQAALLLTAEQLYTRHEHGPALQYYRSALVLGKANAVHYHHASLCAYHVGDKETALSFLKEMEARFTSDQVPAAIWYNMGCFCTRLGRYADAIRHLNRAADAGYDDPNEYRNDPDLAPLRWRSDFKRLLGSLKR